MALLRILNVAAPEDARILKTRSEPVGAVDDALRALAADMLETMYKAPGIGLAAAQVGVLKRLVVMDLSREDAPREPKVFIDPEITWRSEETKPWEEGCLSIPEIYDEVERPARVRVAYTTLEGERVEEEADDLYAVCLQHEIDHCDGVLFTDHLSRLRRDRALAKVKKNLRAA